MARILLVLTLGAMLVIALIWAGWVWMSLGAVDLGANGITAMVLGIVFSMLVGGGLMALVFYSARHGYDDRVISEEPDDETG